MLVITLSDAVDIDPAEDELGRDRYGYSPTMGEYALYDANHGTWKLGQRANSEKYALFQYRDQVVQAVRIDSIEPVPSGRSFINGTVLKAGDPVYDRYVWKQSPRPWQRNPVGYYDAPEDARLCRCGCGDPAPGANDFKPGHDQAALHDRVRQIGTVADFLDWFDRLAKPLTA